MIAATRSPAIAASQNTNTNNSSNTDTASLANVAGGAMGKNEFLKLLVAQMSNQDPLNPMDGKEMAAQLAQFSSVEQLLNINTKLDDMIKVLKPADPPKS